MNFITIEAREALADLDDARLPIPIRRNLAADLVTSLIAMIDVIDGDENLEPSLGFVPLSGDYDLEADCDEDDDTELEPSLGWTEMEARHGCRPTFDADLEGDDNADDEPNLGAPEAYTYEVADWFGVVAGAPLVTAIAPLGSQLSWGRGASHDGEQDSGDEPEGTNEDGGNVEDEGEAVNEDGGDVQDEPHDDERDLI